MQKISENNLHHNHPKLAPVVNGGYPLKEVSSNHITSANAVLTEGSNMTERINFKEGMDKHPKSFHDKGPFNTVPENDNYGNRIKANTEIIPNPNPITKPSGLRNG